MRKAEGLEDALRDSISTLGQVVSLSGPSKSGKTVLVERVVGRDYLIPISGASLQSPDDVWERVLDSMDVPNSTSRNRSLRATIGGSRLPSFVAAAGEAKACLSGDRGCTRGGWRGRVSCGADVGCALVGSLD